MLKTLKRRAAAGLTAIALLAFGAPAAAEPALWVVKDHDSTIYLFGTVHILKPGQSWRSEKVAKALAESSEVVFEVTGMDEPAKLAPLMQKYGFDPQSRLSAKLDPEDRPKLAAAAQTLGVPPQALEPMKPWLAAMTLSVAPLVKAGYDPASGVELALTKEAKAEGKPLTSLETAEQQIRFFADLPPEAQETFLEATLDDLDEGPAQFDRMVRAWQSGDVVDLEAAFLDEMRRDYPGLYKVILVDRNKDWAQQLRTKLAGKGVSFVAVGAGHLVGPDSLQAQLAKLGIRTERR